MFGKIVPEKVKIMKEAFKDKYFDESAIFKWYEDLKNGLLFAKLAPKPGLSENVMNDRSVNIVWGNLQEKQLMTCEETTVSINILKTSIFLSLH